MKGDIDSNILMLTARLRGWYCGGQKGIESLCDREDVPPIIKEAVIHWYEKGYTRFDAIVSELEKLDG